MSARLQSDCRVEWRQRAVRVRERVERLPVDDALLATPPPGGGWSAADVLEHLVLSTASYVAIMRQRVEGQVPTPHAKLWGPTLGGRLLAWSMTSSRRFPAPRGWRPGPTPRPHVCEALARELRELEVLLDEAEGLAWNRLRFGSPEAALVRLNLGDGFLVVLAHAERHLAQIDRALAAVRAS